MNTKKLNRNSKALARLEAQLLSGVKPVKNTTEKSKLYTDLTPNDVTRIKKEIAILKNKVK